MIPCTVTCAIAERNFYGADGIKAGHVSYSSQRVKGIKLQPMERRIVQMPPFNKATKPAVLMREGIPGPAFLFLEPTTRHMLHLFITFFF